MVVVDEYNAWQWFIMVKGFCWYYLQVSSNILSWEIPFKKVGHTSSLAVSKAESVHTPFTNHDTYIYIYNT